MQVPRGRGRGEPGAQASIATIAGLTRGGGCDNFGDNHPDVSVTAKLRANWPTSLLLDAASRVTVRFLLERSLCQRREG
jgi:hypothetical protein